MTQLVQPAIPHRPRYGSAHAPVKGSHAAPSVAKAPSRTALLRAALMTVVPLALLVAMLLGSPSPRYLGDPALARLLHGMAMIKGIITFGALAALWWRAAWPGSVRIALAALVGVAAQVAAVVWIARLVAVPWAAGLFHVGLALLLVSAWREHRMERARQRPVSD